MSPTMIPDQALWATSAASTVYLRATAFLFVRMLPLGYRFMPKIAAAFAISLGSFALSRQRAQSNTSKTSTRRSALPILFGTYSRRNSLSSFAGLLLNILAFLACLDFMYRLHFLHRSESLAFSRTGYVDSTSARIVLRETTSQSQLQFSYTASTGSDRKTLAIPVLSEESDYTATVELTGLVPGTRYSYNTTGSHAGSFVTSPAVSKKFTMISTSCQKPFYPYSPLAHPLTRLPTG
ncbi:hypothetical protein DFH09DRAFT_1504520 [Mycena vulgaris]|nr:hypothetical protein DFH09DRAFT_1504520 [Mycena vulgaris]